MTRQLLLFVVMLATAGPVGARVQSHGLPMSGTVVTLARLPVASARVALIRHTWMASGGEGHQVLTQASTDDQGAFSLEDPVDLKNEVAFPLETAVQFEYTVLTNGRERTIADVAFTAPRNADYSLQSVSEKITVYRYSSDTPISRPIANVSAAAPRPIRT